MENRRPFKSKVLLNITRVVEDGDNLRVVDTFSPKVSGKDLWDSCKERQVAIEMVNAKPQNFRFGVLYVLLTGDTAWIFNKDGEEDDNGA